MNEDEKKKIPCTQSDLSKVQEIFSNVISEKLSDSKLNLHRIIGNFQLLLNEGFEVQPSPEDDCESQRLKYKIEKCQKKGLRLKNTLDVQRNQIISKTSETIEKMLEENSPNIEEFSESEILSDKIQDEEFLSHLSILDDCIEKLLYQLSTKNSDLQKKTEKLNNNAKDIELFLSSFS